MAARLWLVCGSSALPDMLYVNVWGGALAFGHHMGELGCRIIVTLNNIMKTDFKNTQYGVAMLCGGLENANASL